MPADHAIFKRLNDAQWLWYYYNFLEDEKEEFESKRNMTEYLASFIEPEAVRQIISARERAVEVQEDSFRETIKNIGGRDIDIEKFKKSDGKVHSADPKQAMQEYRALKKSDKNKNTSYKDWIDVNLE